jgi:hypothetical protein
MDAALQLIVYQLKEMTNGQEHTTAGQDEMDIELNIRVSQVEFRNEVSAVMSIQAELEEKVTETLEKHLQSVVTAV